MVVVQYQITGGPGISPTCLLSDPTCVTRLRKRRGTVSPSTEDVRGDILDGGPTSRWVGVGTPGGSHGDRPTAEVGLPAGSVPVPRPRRPSPGPEAPMAPLLLSPALPTPPRAAPRVLTR